MSTSVKMSLESKRMLDALQARLVLIRSKRLSQQEILEAMVKLFSEDEDELVEYLAGISLPLSKEDSARLMKMPKDWGVKTAEKDIDKALYGGD